jgi:hypothetical protein
MISKFFIKRPIVAIVIAIVTVIGGLVAMVGLPVAQFPDIVRRRLLSLRPTRAQMRKLSKTQSQRHSNSK